MKKLVKKALGHFGLEIKRTGKKGPFAHVFKDKPKNSLDDDFNWQTYTDHYQEELRHFQKSHTLKLKTGDFSFRNEQLVCADGVLPLHPNHHILYETIYLLKPRKVIEIGCGGGDHLSNLACLMPHVEFSGFDRSEKQIAFAQERSPSLKGKIEQLDITLPYSSLLPNSDLVFTQAVLMHIQTGNGYLVALSNLFKIASKQILLMEDWTRHSFVEDIRYLFERKMIPWECVYFYFRRAPALNNKPHLLVVSSEPLPFESLQSTSQLLD